MRPIHFDLIDLKILLLSMFSIGAVQWVEETFVHVFPLIAKGIQIIIGLMTMVYLWYKIKNAKNGKS